MRYWQPPLNKMDEDNLDRIDELIVGILTKSNGPLTTYKIAKKAKVSWSTVNIHCYKMKSMDMLKEKVENPDVGRRKILWSLTGKTPKLSEYMK